MKFTWIRNPSFSWIHRQVPKIRNYPSCQLVTAINALIFLGGKNIVDCNNFEKYIDMAVCRHGSAFKEAMEDVYSQLNLFIHECSYPLKRYSSKWISKHLPLDTTIWTPKTGFHSVLVYAIKNDYLWITNMFHGYRADVKIHRKDLPVSLARCFHSVKYFRIKE